MSSGDQNFADCLNWVSFLFFILWHSSHRNTLGANCTAFKNYNKRIFQKQEAQQTLSFKGLANSDLVRSVQQFQNSNGRAEWSVSIHIYFTPRDRKSCCYSSLLQGGKMELLLSSWIEKIISIQACGFEDFLFLFQRTYLSLHFSVADHRCIIFKWPLFFSLCMFLFLFCIEWFVILVDSGCNKLEVLFREYNLFHYRK